jgi:outer membrane protein assembly factor BamB
MRPTTARLTLAVALLSAVLAVQPASTQSTSKDWPGWRGPARDGISHETGLLQQWTEEGPPLAWKVTGLGLGFSSVSIVGNRIFTMGDRGENQYVVALDRSNGKELWSAQVGPAWEDEMGGPRGTPTVDGDRVYAIGTEGDLVCLDIATGKLRWKKSAAKDFGGRMMSDWKYTESPLIDGDKLIFTPGSLGNTLVALDKNTGATLWTTVVARIGEKGSNGAGYSSAVVSEGGGVHQYVQLIGRGLIGVRATDGKLLWSYNRIANDVANISTPVVRGDYVFGSTAYGAGSALLKLHATADGVAADEVYFLDAKTFQNHHGGFVLVGDYLYAGHGHSMGLPICIEFLTGKVKWGGNARNAGTGSAAVAYADGRLYFRYQDGLMMLIEATPDGYREKGWFKIPNVRHPSWSHPVILGGRLYLREQDTLYSYDIRAAR